MDQRSLKSRDWLPVGEDAELEALEKEVADAELRMHDSELHAKHAYRRFLFQRRDEASEDRKPKLVAFLEQKIGSAYLRESERAVYDERKTIAQSLEEASRTLRNVSHQKKGDKDEITLFEEAFDFFCGEAAAESNSAVLGEALEDAQAAILSRRGMDQSAKDEFGRELDEVAKAKALDWRCRYPWRAIK